MADVSSYKVYGTLPTIGEEQVKKLIEQSESGTLPEVTADDNGKILTVVNGEWNKANSGGGGGVLVVNGTPSSEEITLDKTWQEICDAVCPVLKIDYTIEGMTEISFRFPDSILIDDGRYIVGFFGCSMQVPMEFITDSADGYPVYTIPGDGDGN